MLRYTLCDQAIKFTSNIWCECQCRQFLVLKFASICFLSSGTTPVNHHGHDRANSDHQKDGSSNTSNLSKKNWCFHKHRTWLRGDRSQIFFKSASWVSKEEHKSWHTLPCWAFLKKSSSDNAPSGWHCNIRSKRSQRSWNFPVSG